MQPRQIRTLLHFTECLLSRPRGQQVWHVWITVVHGAWPAILWDAPIARSMLAAFLAGVAARVLLFARQGYSRILGLAHALWVPAIAQILAHLPDHRPHSGYEVWLVVAAVNGGGVLAWDARQVWRWWQGERAPLVPDGAPRVEPPGPSGPAARP